MSKTVDFFKTEDKPVIKQKIRIAISLDCSGSMDIKFGCGKRIEAMTNALICTGIPGNVEVGVFPFGRNDDNRKIMLPNPKELSELKTNSCTYSNGIKNSLDFSPEILIFYGDGSFSDNNLTSILKSGIKSNLRVIWIILPQDTPQRIRDTLRRDVGEVIDVVGSKHGIAIQANQVMLDFSNNSFTIKDIYRSASEMSSYSIKPNHWVAGEFFSFDRDLTAPEITKDIVEHCQGNYDFINKFFDFILKTLTVRATAVTSPLWGKIHKIACVLNSRFIDDASIINYNEEFTKVKNSFPLGSPERKAMEEIKEFSFSDDAETKKLIDNLPRKYIIGFLSVNGFTRNQIVVAVKSKLQSLSIVNYLENHSIISIDNVKEGCPGFPILKDGLEKKYYKMAVKLFFSQFPPILNVTDIIMFSLLIRILGSRDSLSLSEDVYNTLFNAIDVNDIIKYLLVDDINDIFYSPKNYIPIANFFHIYGDTILKEEIGDINVVRKVNIWKIISIFAKIITMLRSKQNYQFIKTIRIQKPQGKSDILNACDVKVSDIFLFNSYDKDPCPTMPSVGHVISIQESGDRKSVFIKVEYLDNPKDSDDTLVFRSKKNKTITFIKKVLMSDAPNEVIDGIRDYLMEIKKNPPCEELKFDYENPPSFNPEYNERLMTVIRKIIDLSSDGMIEMIDKIITINVPIANFFHVLGYPDTILQMIKAGSNMGRKDIEQIISDYFNPPKVIDLTVEGIRENSSLVYILTSEEVTALVEYINNYSVVEETKNMIKIIENTLCFCGDEIQHCQDNVKMCKCCNPIHKKCYEELLSRSVVAPGEYFNVSTIACPYCKNFYPNEDIPDIQIVELLKVFPEGPPKNHLWRSCRYRNDKCNNIISGENQSGNGCAETVFPDTCDSCLEASKNASKYEEIMKMEICYISPEGPAIHDGHCVHITGDNGYYCLMCKEGDPRGSYESSDHTYECTSYGAFPDINLNGGFSISYDWMSPNPMHFYLFSDNVDWESAGIDISEFSKLIRSILGDCEFERLSRFDGFNL